MSVTLPYTASFIPSAVEGRTALLQDGLPSLDFARDEIAGDLA